MSNNNSDNKYSSKSCYRLYAGHGNWINLNQKTTQDLLQILRDGVPCRYPLAEGLAIDIIPNDVDCNSKNIDMLGLMRADLVYETQADENNVQQLMSHYIRSLLDEQGIIDAFPPLRTGEDLPIVTSIPTHRHLSMVPSVVGAVRRGPKPNSVKKSSNNNSSSSSIHTHADGTNDHSLASSISSSSSASPTRNRKKPPYSVNTKRGDTASHHNKKLRGMDQLSPTNAVLPMEMNNYVQLYDNHPHYLDMNPSPTTSSHTEYHHQQQHNHSYNVNPMIPTGFGQSHEGEEDSDLWMPFQQQQNSSATRSTAAFNFDFPMAEFDRPAENDAVERQSPTDILHEYEFSQQHHHHRGFEGDLYNSTSGSILEDSHAHPIPPSSGSADTYVSPTSPWVQQQHYHYNSNNAKKQESAIELLDNSSTSKAAASQDNDDRRQILHRIRKESIDSHDVTTLHMDRLLLSRNNSNYTNGGASLALSHGDNEST